MRAQLDAEKLAGHMSERELLFLPQTGARILGRLNLKWLDRMLFHEPVLC